MSFKDYLTNDLRKQHLNLSSYAWNIISSDIYNFCQSEKNKEMSNFINRIYKNFEEMGLFPTNLDKSLNHKYLFYEQSFNPYNNDDSLPSQKIASQMIDKELSEILSMTESRIKGIGKKIYLHISTYNSLCSIPENSYINKIFKKPGNYLKFIMEEYSKLPYYQREGIYFNRIISIIEDAVKLNYTLNIFTNDMEFEVIPYKIESDSFQNYHYLVGMASQIISSHRNFQPASFRISRITNIKTNRTYKELTVSQEKELNMAIKKRGAQFILNDTSLVRVKFTKEGIKKYNSQLYLRPDFTNIIDKYIYEFDITLFQAEAYFFKFGKDAEILYPETLRSVFYKKYKDAEILYQKKSEITTF